ncbi:MAG: PIG-L family deacetylase [Verrucomicrobiota bacterium]
MPIPDIPDNTPLPKALARITHLGIGAHADDLEFMAFHGIAQCHQSPNHWFGGVTCSDGSGCSRSGPFANFTDDQMKAARAKEQTQAAEVGKYAAQWQLDYPSAAIKDSANSPLVPELSEIIKATKPNTIYTHNLADKHDTHVAVTTAVIAALRSLPEDVHPEQLLGCEMWRDLDWMLAPDKVPLDNSNHDNLAKELNEVFQSQISGGKRYDRAVLGRRYANATFFSSHTTDDTDQLWFAMDLTPLMKDPSLDPIDFTTAHIDRFRQDVADRIKRYSP